MHISSDLSYDACIIAEFRAILNGKLQKFHAPGQSRTHEILKSRDALSKQMAFCSSCPSGNDKNSSSTFPASCHGASEPKSMRSAQIAAVFALDARHIVKNLPCRRQKLFAFACDGYSRIGAREYRHMQLLLQKPDGFGQCRLRNEHLPGRLAERSANSHRIGISQLLYGHEVRYRSEEHTSELQSRCEISYAVFCL